MGVLLYELLTGTLPLGNFEPPSKLNKEINRLDPNAFVVMSSLNDTRGGMIKKRIIH